MRKIVYSGLVLGLSLMSCKDGDKKNGGLETREISFTKEGSLTIIKPDSIGSITLDIEIADDDYQRQTGLMYRNSMAENQGMLFIMEREEQQAFYMKNTRIPLDIIYLNEAKEIVGFQENAQPLNSNSLPSGNPAKYVLEVNAGLARKWKLYMGDTLTWTID